MTKQQPAGPHPWYLGGCDALGPDGSCAECDKLSGAAVPATTDAHPSVEIVFFGLPYAGTRRHLRFSYTNWRGEVSNRTVKPRGVTWTATEWHPEPQWLLEAWDVDKCEDRLFAMRDMKDVQHAD